MENLKVVNPEFSGAVMMPNIVLETEDGIRINTNITYEDIANIRSQREGRGECNGLH